MKEKTILEIGGAGYIGSHTTLALLQAGMNVVDLADGHLQALQAIQTRNGANVWNPGTGQGYSVLNMLSAFEAASGRKVPYRFSPRRPGDVATCYADVSKATTELGWRWQYMNPNGYK